MTCRNFGDKLNCISFNRQESNFIKSPSKVEAKLYGKFSVIIRRNLFLKTNRGIVKYNPETQIMELLDIPLMTTRFESCFVTFGDFFISTGGKLDESGQEPSKLVTRGSISSPENGN